MTVNKDGWKPGLTEEEKERRLKLIAKITGKN